MLQAQIPVLSVLSVVLCSENVSGKQIPWHPSPATTGEAKACVSKLVLYVSCVAGILVHLLPSENLGDIHGPAISVSCFCDPHLLRFLWCWLYPITLQNDVAIFTSR